MKDTQLRQFCRMLEHCGHNFKIEPLQKTLFFFGKPPRKHYANLFTVIIQPDFWDELRAYFDENEDLVEMQGQQHLRRTNTNLEKPDVFVRKPSTHKLRELVEYKPRHELE